jgi:hypothetical protein
MKKMMMTIAMVTCMFLGLQAQSPFDKFFEKYSGKNGYTSVNVTKDMFQMFMSMANDKTDAESKEMQDMLTQLTGLKMLTYKDSTGSGKEAAFYNEASALFPSADYKELMTVNDEGENIRFLTKPDGPKKISEMVMLMRGKNESMVMSLTGTIDLATVSKLSKNMNLPGMDKLKK